MNSIPLCAEAQEEAELELEEFRIPRGELLALINDTISVAEGFRAKADRSLIDYQPCVPKGMLAALLYCYVRGIYGSQQIEEAFKNDDELCLLAQCRPDRELLRKFRRAHRKMIHHSLKHLQWFVRVKYCSSGQAPVASGACARATGLSMKVESETSECLYRAAFVDKMMLDV
jgi:hypothetical protein